MITHRLVLILGAGASIPYGFPSGKLLKARVSDDLRPNVDTPMRRQLLEAGFRAEEMRAFQHDLLRSGKQSVDAFLEHRDEFVRIGKAAIACALLPLEREESFFTRNEQDWYQYFFNKLNARFEEFDQNSVSVLTLNYDRSLEHYLFTTLRNAYGKSPDDCAAKLGSLPIIHLYGQLGNLPYLEGDGVEFGAAVTTANLQKCTDGIRVVYEDARSLPQFKEAYGHLQRAARICFLGFGYDATNLARVLAYGPTPDQQVYGSTVGFVGQEFATLYTQLGRFGLRAGIPFDPKPKNALDYLRSSGVFDWE